MSKDQTINMAEFTEWSISLRDGTVWGKSERGNTGFPPVGATFRPCDSYEAVVLFTEEGARRVLTHYGYTLTPAAKPEAKPADVPVVNAVWVEDTMADGSKSLTAYSGRESAESCAKLDMERGRARIVRIRSVDEEARESAAAARQIADNVSDRVDELAERVRALEKPADKPAARVVKLPKFRANVHGAIVSPNSLGTFKWGFEHAIAAVRDALTSQGITVEAAE